MWAARDSLDSEQMWLQKGKAVLLSHLIFSFYTTVCRRTFQFLECSCFISLWFFSCVSVLKQPQSFLCFLQFCATSKVHEARTSIIHPLCPNCKARLQERTCTVWKLIFIQFTVPHTCLHTGSEESKHEMKLQDGSEELICPKNNGLTKISSFVISLIFCMTH